MYERVFNWHDFYVKRVEKEKYHGSLAFFSVKYVEPSQRWMEQPAWAISCHPFTSFAVILEPDYVFRAHGDWDGHSQNFAESVFWVKMQEWNVELEEVEVGSPR